MDYRNHEIIGARIVIAHLIELLPFNEAHAFSGVRVTRLPASASGSISERWRIDDRAGNNAVEHVDARVAASEITRRAGDVIERDHDERTRRSGRAPASAPNPIAAAATRAAAHFARRSAATQAGDEALLDATISEALRALAAEIENGGQS